MAGNKAIYDTAMKRAHQYAWSSQWDRAIKEYNRALAEIPNDPTAQRNVAQCLFRLQKWPEAQQAYEALLTADPKDLFALNRIAEVHLALARNDLALATYNRLADLYIEGKQLHEAMRALRDISRALPRDIQLHTRILTIAQEIGDKQAELAEHLAISNIALDDNNLGDAAAHAEAASAIDPDNAEVKRWGYAVRRRVAEAAGTGKIEGDMQPQNALSSVMAGGLVGAKEPDPPEAANLITQAEQAQEQGDYRAALDLYDKAVKAGARGSHAFYNAGLLNQQMGRPGMAIPYLDRAAADPEFATSAYYVQGLCYNILQYHAKAVAAFERALTLINTDQLTRNEADELIELYSAAAEANLADGNTGRAGSLYATLVKIFKERRWQHPRLPELESKANELYNAGIMSKLEGISRGSNVLTPAGKSHSNSPGTSSMNTSYMDGDEAGTASMGTSSMGTSSMGTSSMGTASMGTASMGTASMGTSSMGTSSMGTNSIESPPSAQYTPPTETQSSALSPQHSDNDLPTTRMPSHHIDSDLLRSVQEAAVAPGGESGATDPAEATSLIASPDGVVAEDGTNMLRPGTKIIEGQQDGSAGGGGADIATTRMSRPGSNLRTITEYLRAAGSPTAEQVPVAADHLPLVASLTPDNQLLTTESKHAAMLAETEGAIREGLWDVAVDNCLSIIVSDPDYLPIHMVLGDIYMAQAKTDEAITKYSTVMDTYVARGEAGDAAEACRRLLTLEPDNPTIKTRLGLLLLDAGQVDEAARALLAIVADYHKAGDTKTALTEAENLKIRIPLSSDVALAVGTYRLHVGETREAVGELGRALQLDPSNDTALARLYLALAWLNDPTQWDALDSLMTRSANSESDTRLFLEEIYAGLQQKPLPPVYYGLSLVADRADLDNVAADALDDGLTQLSLAPTTELDNSWPLIEALMSQFRGDLALNAKDGAVATQHYRRALKVLEAHTSAEGGAATEAQDAESEGNEAVKRSTLVSPRPQYTFMRVPEPVQLYYGMAEAYTLTEDWDGALEAFEGLKQLIPNDQSVYTRMADIHFRQGQLTRALGELNEVLVLYQKAGDHEKTLEALGYMARLAPNNTAVRRKLSDMYLKLGMTEYGLAELDTLAELQLKAGQLKDAMRTYQKSADLYYTMGQHDEALAIYERIVRLAPRDIDTRQQLINMYIQAGKLAEAIDAERALAEVFIQDGQVEGAVAALHQLLALSPEDLAAHNSLAQQLVSIGEYGQAARLYGRMARLDPDNPRNTILQQEMQRMAQEANDEEDLMRTGPLKKERLSKRAEAKAGAKAGAKSRR